MEDYEGRVLSVAEELEATRAGYQGACEEIAQLKEQLLSMGVLQDQQQLLQQEVGGCGCAGEGVWSGGSIEYIFVSCDWLVDWFSAGEA